MIPIDQIRHYPLFAGLTEAELASLAARLVRRSFARNAYLFHPGNPGLNIYLIESGLIRVFFTDARGQEFLLNLAGPRAAMGLPLLTGEQVRLLGAAAAQETVTLLLAREDLFDLMEHSPQFNRNIYLEMTLLMRKLVLHYQSLVTVGLEGRTATLILHLSNGREVLELPISQAEMAGWLGASRGRLNRVLTRLQQLGLIRVEGQQFIILDRPGLEKQTEGLSLLKV